MRVGLLYNAGTGDRTWDDGSVRDADSVPAAFWTNAVENTNEPFAAVSDGLLSGQQNSAALGYLCEVNDLCKLCPREGAEDQSIVCGYRTTC